MIDTAYYYPAPFWLARDGGWIKSLLLFFDEIAILLPNYMHGRHVLFDPTLAEPLEDLGLLRLLEPNDWVDEETTNKLAEIMVELLTDGTFDDLPEVEHFQELSQSRIGYCADIDLAKFLVEELRLRNLARPSEDGGSIPLHPTVRTTILVILAQLSRAAGTKRGTAVHPTTNYPPAIKDLIETLSRQRMPSRGNIVQLDIEPVSFDLDLIPLDDVLQFRVEHQEAHRMYMRNLRGFMSELAEIEEFSERESLLLERQQEIADLARDIQRSTGKTLGGKSLPSWSLGIAGSIWSFANCDIIGTVLGLVGLAPGKSAGTDNIAGAYSYLFQAEEAFRG